MNLATKSEIFCAAVVGQFHSRTEIEGHKHGLASPATMKYEIINNTAWFHLTSKDEAHSFTVPIPFLRDNVMLLEQNEVHRAVCPYYVREDDRMLDYHVIMQMIITDTGSCDGILSPIAVKNTPFIQQLVYSFDNANTSTVIYRLQRAINEVVNRMPLHETLLNSWVMNRRLMIIDPAFKTLRSPEDRLNYQVEKSKAFFPRGWTPVGLADGNLADKNYTLATDIRRLTPFGMNYHNPQRNLYSTLKMKGAQLPNISSASMEELHLQGIKRTGWNWFTLFADIPDTFEDQIMVDNSHRTKYINFDKRFQCYGTLKVKTGRNVKRGDTLSVSEKAVVKKFNIDCDKAKVTKIVESTTSVGGVETPVYNVVIKCKRFLRDGMKVTNLHGNKGIIRMKDLGYAVDPRTGALRKIDLIVSARSIHKRKNYGQIF
jgi:hypothetical protein